MTVKLVGNLHPSLHDVIRNFLLNLEISNRSPGTIENQRSTLGCMADFASEQQWPPLEKLNKTHLRQYLAALRTRPRWFGKRDAAQKPISDSYYKTHYRRLKRFFNWCVAEGFLEQNPLADIPHPKVPQRVIPTVSDGFVEWRGGSVKLEA